MTVGDLYTLNRNVVFDYIEIWQNGRLVLEQTLMDSMHLAWYDWQIKSFICVPMWSKNALKYVVTI